jgi:hypothetical protein
MSWNWKPALSAAVLAVLMGPAAAGPADTLVDQIKAVGREGRGNRAAAVAWRDLVRLGPDAMPDILLGLDTATPTAANWLHAAVDAIAEHALVEGKALPAARLELFIRDTRHAGPGRRLAYEWLNRVDPSAALRLLPQMLDDPGAELRRDAVALALTKAQTFLKKGDKVSAKTAFREAFRAARDLDQVEEAAKVLKDLGAPVDITAHLGCLTHWLLIGPFDNTGGAGFARMYPPEQHVDLAARLDGKKGLPLAWKDHACADVYGKVDLNQAVGKHMGAVAYAFAAVQAPAELPVEIRAMSNNAVKILLNGKEIFFRDEYHHGTRVDQHVGRGTLRQGRNEVLIKVCQNEQKDDWAQSWGFQLRVCDGLGAGIPVTAFLEKPGQPTRAERGQP